MEERFSKIAVQYFKYSLMGGVAFLVHLFIFYLFSAFIFPALNPGDLVVRLIGLPAALIDDMLRAKNSMINNLVAFLFSNMTAYLLNIRWVFKSGRHHRLLEIAFFYAVSGVSVGAGSVLMGFIINRYGTDTSLAFGANIITTGTINFLMRKFFIFKT